MKSKINVLLLVFMIVMLLQTFIQAEPDNSQLISQILLLEKQTDEKITKNELGDLKVDMIANKDLPEFLHKEGRPPIYYFYYTPADTQLIKVYYDVGLESLLAQHEYLFYEDNSLALYSYRVSASGGKEAFDEDWYYFYKGKVFRVLETGEPPKEKDFCCKELAEHTTILKNAELLQKAFQNIMNLPK